MSRQEQNRDGYTSLRIDKEFWKKVKIAAINAGKDVSQFVEDTLKEKLSTKTKATTPQ